jgi:phosphoribosylanthranilate isomerase
MGTRVKICGITRVEAGANALGFIFYEKSPRFVPVAQAANICASLPPFVSKVGVFVNEIEYPIEKALAECGLDTLQFHGDEPPGFCQKFPAKSIKAFRIKTGADLGALEEYDVDAWLLDAFSEKEMGGTGKTFDWNLAAKAVERGRPVILSGGLNPDNVTEAIQKVRPYAVDVSSGVEVSPGIKDHEKILSFLQKTKHA